MKLWQLTAVCRPDSAALFATLSKPEWSEFAFDLERYNKAIDEQDRGFLDQVIPPELVEDVLQKTTGHIYFDGEQLRSHQFSKSDQLLSFVEAYRRYGGAALEEVLEKGSLSVERARKFDDS